MHSRRLIVAAVALPLLYLYISRLSPLFFLILLGLIVALGQMEFHAMYRTRKTLSLLGTAGGTSVFLLYAYAATLPPPQFTAAPPLALLYPVLSILFFMFISSARLFIVKNPEAAMKDLAPVVTGFLYIPTLLLPQWFLRLDGYAWIFFLYGCVWSSDSMAYYIGKGMGKRKLYKEVSPNKTVAGAFGSVIGGVLSAVILGTLLLKGMAVPVLAATGGATGAITIAGDLVESMFKRDAGVKDSGSIIPGHGGILDKIDGVLFAGPTLCMIKWLL